MNFRSKIYAKFVRAREKIWFKMPYWSHRLDYQISKFFFHLYGLIGFPKSRGIRYFPHRLTYIDPRKIKHYDADRFFSSIHYVQAGDWDLKKAPLADKLQQRFVRELLASDSDFQDLPCFSEYLARVEARGVTHQEALQIVGQKADSVKGLYRDLQAHGYKSQAELGKSSRNKFNTWYDEIRISIDRNGEYILNGSGNHRLAVAQVLGLERVPAVLIRMHYQYFMDSHEKTKKLH